MLLTPEQIDTQASGVPSWNVSEEGNSISRLFTFENFAQSIHFFNSVANIAEEINHHPDIQINFKKVTLTLSTHSAGGLTEKDFLVAQKIDQLPMPTSETLKDEPFWQGDYAVR